MSDYRGDYVHLPEPAKNQPRFRSSSLTWANTIAFLTTVHGRDKFYRLLQFSFKQIALMVARDHPAGPVNPVSDACSKIAGGLVAGRRFLRLGSLPGMKIILFCHFNSIFIINRYARSFTSPFRLKVPSRVSNRLFQKEMMCCDIRLLAVALRACCFWWWIISRGLHGTASSAWTIR